MHGLARAPLAPSARVAYQSGRRFYVTSRYYQQQVQQPQQQHASPSPHRNFYKSHGRALFKALTLAFFSYQCFYWAWTTLETEELKDGKNREIKSLETEVRLLEEGRNSHRPSLANTKGVEAGERLLEEKKG